MITHYDSMSSGRSMWLRTLTNTTAMLLIGGSLCLLAADTWSRVAFDDRLFAVADNLFVVGAVLSCILAVVYIRAARSTEMAWSLRRRIIVSVVCGVIAAVIVLSANSFYSDFVGIFQVGFSLVIGLNVGIILLNVTMPFRSRTASLANG